ncbi:MAG: hypothetical protein MAG451_02313 [Anaerolineales bacterium]|nr:hypothetical protein [Anaerolineales bacterium]
MSGSGLTDAEIEIIIRQLFEEELTQKEEERLLSQLERAEDDVLPVLRTMLRSRDRQTVDTAASVLAHWSAEERTIHREIVTPLQQMVEDPHVSDRAKVAVAGILAEQGAPPDPDAFRAQLEDPREMVRATLRSALDQADSDMARSAFLESLQEEPLEIRVGLVHDLAALDDARAPRLLAPLLYATNEAIVRAVLGVAGKLLEAPAELRVALEDLADEHPKQAIRERASKLLKRLVPADRLTPQAPLHGAWITSVDGDGGQMIVLTRRLAPGYVTMLNVYFNDLEGIQDYTVVEGVGVAELEDLLSGLEAEGVLIVEADLPTCRSLLADARAATVRAGLPLPLSYGVWRDLLAGDDARDLEVPDLAPVDVHAHPAWLAESDQLLEHPAYAYWFFDPDELPNRFAAAYRSKPTAGGRRAAVEEAIQAHVGDDLRAALRERLWRQADVLARLGDDEAVQRTLAVAAVLAPDAGTALQHHPLLQVMMRRTLEDQFEER